MPAGPHRPLHNGCGLGTKTAPFCGSHAHTQAAAAAQIAARCSGATGHSFGRAAGAKRVPMDLLHGRTKFDDSRTKIRMLDVFGRGVREIRGGGGG
jgi:hypothetical protein